MAAAIEHPEMPLIDCSGMSALAYRKRDGLFRFCAALGARGRQRRLEG